MARHTIIEKIARELHEGIDSERQVVYLLVEARKLMEIDQEAANYKTLKFSCDWVAHPILTGPVAQEIVRQFDRFQQLIDEMKSNKDGEQVTPDWDSHGKLGKTLKLSQFRSELGAYLTKHGLNSSVADDDRKWANFLTYYGRVIEDCPLRCVSQGLKYTDEVVLRVVQVDSQQLADATGHRLVIEWSWKSKITGVESINQQFY